jgi:type I restriction enzyme S subunit
MTGRWRLVPFKDAVADESGGNVKTPQGEYLSDGRFAVVDQGKQLISGYVNDPSRLCLARLPVIVFGDHTRCIKFVDFPFCMGADGTKVLRPKLDTDTRYLYHYLRQLRLPDGGYDRHFKYLRRINVLLPPLAEQRRIAEVLDRAEALRAKRRATLAALDALTHAVFLDIFGDPATNPKGWPSCLLGDLFGIARGGSPRPIDAYFTDDPDGINWVLISDASDGEKYITATKKRIRPEGASRSRRVQPGDFLLTNSMSFGRPYIMRTYGCIHDGWLVLSPKTDDIDADFFYELLGSRAMYAEFERRAAGATVKNLNIDLVRGVRVPIPPRSIQRDFARRTGAIEALRATQLASLNDLASLFASLQHRAFLGEL